MRSKSSFGRKSSLRVLTTCLCNYPSQRDANISSWSRIIKWSLLEGPDSFFPERSFVLPETNVITTAFQNIWCLTWPRTVNKLCWYLLYLYKGSCHNRSLKVKTLNQDSLSPTAQQPNQGCIRARCVGQGKNKSSMLYLSLQSIVSRTWNRWIEKD